VPTRNCRRNRDIRSTLPSGTTSGVAAAPLREDAQLDDLTEPENAAEVSWALVER